MRFALLVLSGSVLVLGACASTPEPMESKRSIRTDTAYVAAVEQAARRRGLALQWVNPPKLRVEDESKPR